MTKVLSILLVFCILIIVESSHVDGKVKEKKDIWKRGVDFRHGSMSRTSSRGWRKKSSQMNGGSQGARHFNAKSRKIQRKGRQMVGSSPIEDLVKTIARRTDLTGSVVEAIAAKLGVPIPALPESRPPAVPSK